MGSTTSTPERLGSARSFIGYSPTGGRCPRRGCKRDAPQVRMGDKLFAMPCEVHDAEMTEEWAREEREQEAQAALIKSGLSQRQLEFTLDSYEKCCGDEAGRAALDVARRWLRTYLDGGDAGNLVLWGPIGTGKTGLASGIVRAVCEEGRVATGTDGEPFRVHAARMVNFKALLDSMKECFDRHEPTRLALGAGSTPMLVLDDIGAERPTAWARDQLLGIVDHRYERGLPTVYVSNYSPADLARRLGHDDVLVGQRIVSRMRERATIFEFTGSDRRTSVGPTS